MGTVSIVVIALALLATYLTWMASRMDRLHARTDAARAALDAQLVRRAAAALEVATASGVEPLRAAASAAYHASVSERAELESALSDALRAAPVSGPAAAELGEAGRRVVLARKFYNEAVRDTQTLRRRRLVRALRLTGHAPEPQFFDIDDTPPTTSDTPPTTDGPVTAGVVT